MNVSPGPLFFKYPESSGGLVRPYELFAISMNPIDWFEFSLSIGLFVRIEIKVGALFNLDVEFLWELITLEYKENVTVCNGT